MKLSELPTTTLHCEIQVLQIKIDSQSFMMNKEKYKTK